MWKSHYWQAEFWTVLLCTITLGFLGSIFSLGSVFVAIILTAYLIWHLYQLSRLFHWVFISKAIYPPSALGIWGEVFNHLYNQQRKHRSDLKKLNSVIAEFRDSTRALKEGALIISNIGEIRWFNKAAAKLIGLKQSIDIGQRLFNLLRHPDFIEYEAAGDFSKPVIIPSPLDPNLMLNINITPYNENQRLVIVRDITDKFHLERVRQDFVANVSHELRTPLTVISGYLEMLDPEVNPNLKSISKPLSMMRQQALNMAHLVDDLLLLSKLDSKADTNGHKNIDINLLLDSICAEARALSSDKNQEILFHSHTNATLKASEKQLRSAFSNLIFNAVRYTPKDGKIDIYWQEDDDHFIVKVKDNGPGIEAEHLPRLTERFYRVDTGRTRSQGGTGLGLAIVKHVLEYHNAELKIESTVGKGSSFACYFPKYN